MTQWDPAYAYALVIARDTGLLAASPIVQDMVSAVRDLVAHYAEIAMGTGFGHVTVTVRNKRLGGVEWLQSRMF